MDKIHNFGVTKLHYISCIINQFHSKNGLAIINHTIDIHNIVIQKVVIRVQLRLAVLFSLYTYKPNSMLSQIIHLSGRNLCVSLLFVMPSSCLSFEIKPTFRNKSSLFRPLFYHQKCIQVEKIGPTQLSLLEATT